jgi:hypothetical protein
MSGVCGRSIFGMDAKLSLHGRIYGAFWNKCLTFDPPNGKIWPSIFTGEQFKSKIWLI